MQALFIACVFLALVYAGEVSFSPERGFYSSPFKLTLELPKKLQGGTAQIKYFTYNTDPQGPNPSANGGLVYAQPLTISVSCYVIAAAFDKGQIVSDMVTHTFLFPRDILTDTTVAFTPARLAALGANGSTRVLSGLMALPTVALTSAFEYPYPLVSYNCIPCMADNDRATRFEWIDPAHPKDHLFYSDASFDIYGTSSRGYSKKNLKINFNSGALKYDFFNEYNFGQHAAKRFKELAFRAHSQDGPFGYNVYFPLYLKNLFQEYTQQDAGQLCSHGRMVHIYFNSKYQGIYHMREKLSNTNYFQEYFGGEDEDYEGIGGDKWSYGGRMTPEEKALYTTWNEMHTTPTWDVLSKYVDWDQWCTFAIIQSYTCNADLGYLHNIQLGGPKKPKTWNGPNSGWRYQPSGPDSSWYMSGLNENSDCVGYGNIDLFNNVWGERHPDFVMKFHDHIFKMLEAPDATLSYAQSRQRFERMIAMFSLDDSVALELYRWGFNLWGVAEWRDNIARTVGTWIVNRATTLLGQYATRTMTNAYGGVLFNLADRAVVPAKANLTISPQKSGAGCVIQYTTNGQDPRLPGGAISGLAIQLALGGSITLTEPVSISARLQCAPSGWGPINTVQLNVLPSTKDTCAMCKNVIFTEFSYNPDTNESSFVEIKNIGSKPLVMTGATIKGLWNYTFPTLTLAPGQFWVVGHKLLAFYHVYKKNADDYHIYHYDRKLDAKKFTLTDQYGNTVHEVTLSDSRPWSEFADGVGFTLVADPQSYKDIAANSAKSKKWHFQFWRYSAALLGSPWQDDPTPKDRQKMALQFTFVSYFSKTQWVELYNPTLGDIDISGWILTNDLYDNSDDYTVPKGTVVKAMQKLKIKDDKFDFKLKQSKDVALLETKAWKGDSLVTGQAIWFNAEDNSLAF